MDHLESVFAAIASSNNGWILAQNLSYDERVAAIDGVTGGELRRFMVRYLDQPLIAYTLPK